MKKNIKELLLIGLISSNMLSVVGCNEANNIKNIEIKSTIEEAQEYTTLYTLPEELEKGTLVKIDGKVERVEKKYKYINYKKVLTHKEVIIEPLNEGSGLLLIVKIEGNSDIKKGNNVVIYGEVISEKDSRTKTVLAHECITIK